MNIFVTGASGLLGSEICRHLGSKGSHRIIGLVRTMPSIKHEGVHYIEGDILHTPFLEEVLEKYEIEEIIHAAAAVSFSPKDKTALYETNVDGTTNIVNTALLKKVKRLIHISSVAAIGKPEKVLDAPEPVKITEEFKWADSPINSNYAKSKYLAELEVWRGQAEGLKTVILNPSTILGAGDLSKSSTQLFNYVYKGNKFLTEGSINYVDLLDVVDIIERVIQSDIQNERFIVSAGQISYEEFFGLMAGNMNRKKPRIKLGKWAIAILWRIESLRSFITGANPLITKETAISARSNIYFDPSKLIRTFNFRFTPIKESISRVCKELNLSS